MLYIKTNQGIHDLEVNRIARRCVQQGYAVFADLPDLAKPPRLLGYIPDIYAEKKILPGNPGIWSIVVVEVETQDTIGSDQTKMQIDALRTWCASRRAKFDLVMAN